MNRINQEDKCLVCVVMTSIQRNYDHVWLPKEGMWDKNAHTNHHPLCLLSERFGVNHRSQSSSAWQVWALQHPATFRHVRKWMSSLGPQWCFVRNHTYISVGILSNHSSNNLLLHFDTYEVNSRISLINQSINLYNYSHTHALQVTDKLIIRQYITLETIGDWETECVRLRWWWWWKLNNKNNKTK